MQGSLPVEHDTEYVHCVYVCTVCMKVFTYVQWSESGCTMTATVY